jgi:hypothetical protein
VSDLVELIQKNSISTLREMTGEVLSSVEKQIVDEIGGFLALREQQGDVIEAFVTNMNNCFDELLDKEVIKQEAVFDFETLSLVQEEELDVMVALEGMVNACRNDHLANFISFNTRLNSLFPRKRLDETNNPLDPEQIATAFQEALRPVGLDAHNTLMIYRAFNNEVLKHLDDILQDANKILVDSGVIPNLGMESSSKKDNRPVRSAQRNDPGSTFGTVEEEEMQEDVERPEMFSMMQNLMHGDKLAPSSPDGGAQAQPNPTDMGQIPEGHVVVPASQVQQYMIPAALIPGGGDQSDGAMQPFQPAPDQQVEMVDQAKLMEILTNIQNSLNAQSPEDIPTSLDDVQRVDISESLGEILNTDQDDGVVSAVDRESSDVINLVTLLYGAIWDDESVPIPIKELIGRTQITIIKVALSDTTFFNKENHPARAILNEFASAGIGWTEVEKLEEDPLYKKIQDLVEIILNEYDDDISFFEELISHFRAFRAGEAKKAGGLEQSLLHDKERQERLEDIHELVTQKINERILGRELHPFVKYLLEDIFHKFMVMLVIKEGPGSNAWKQAINTIDVLLWSVQPHEQKDDHGRLKIVNPRLLNNLRKAFRIASIEVEKIDALITELQEVQEDSFDSDPEVEEEDSQQLESDEAESTEDNEILPLSEAHNLQTEQPDEAAIEPETVTEESSLVPDEEEPVIEDNTAYLEQVEAMTVGTWVEFAGEEELNTRCKLAAKINAIDKFIFVNRQGVKVVEKTSTGLAEELKDGTVHIISDGLLFSRALESVIGNLRDSQHEQQTGSAYQPTI